MRTASLAIAQPTPQQLLDYANALTLVNTYAYTITNQQLPVLLHPTSHYVRFAEQLVPAKMHALEWSNGLFVSLLTIPKLIKKGGGTLFDLEKLMIQQYLNILIANPSDNAAKEGLSDALATMTSMIDAQVDAVVKLEADLNAFQRAIKADAEILITIARGALDDVEEDKDKIAKLNEEIENLRKQIKQAQVLLTLSQVGSGISIFTGLIGVALIVSGFGVKAGVAILVTSVAGEAASIAGWVIETKRIALLEAEIQSDNQQIDERYQDIALLQQVSGQFRELSEANEKAAEALGRIKGMWNLMGNAINAVKQDLATTGQEITRADYRKALTDFGAAERAWRDVVALATSLAGIEYKWQSKDGQWHNYLDAAPNSNQGLIEVPKHAA
jgi:hypothetical protein